MERGLPVIDALLDRTATQPKPTQEGSSRDVNLWSFVTTMCVVQPRSQMSFFNSLKNCCFVPMNQRLFEVLTQTCVECEVLKCPVQCLKYFAIKTCLYLLKRGPSHSWYCDRNNYLMNRWYINMFLSVCQIKHWNGLVGFRQLQSALFCLFYTPNNSFIGKLMETLQIKNVKILPLTHHEIPTSHFQKVKFNAFKKHSGLNLRPVCSHPYWQKIRKDIRVIWVPVLATN